MGDHTGGLLVQRVRGIKRSSLKLTNSTLVRSELDPSTHMKHRAWAHSCDLSAGEGVGEASRN